ncbi:MAG: hypothetical protein WBN08_02700 [Thiogranum sp.]
MKLDYIKFAAIAVVLGSGIFTASFVAAADSSKSDDPPSADCAKFAGDPNTNVGDIIRAGCKPTLAQMSALMDNPVGNVAMWWNQVDYYGLENPKFNKSDHKTNYMGIIQWPQALNSNWNLINRVVYNVTRSPIDDDKVDDFGSTQGGLLPPSNFGRQSPLDVFGGSTTGLGDSYYVGLVSPKKPLKMGKGNLVWGLGFDAGFPTASKDVLGSEKYTAGPSALGVYLGPKWKVGSLAQHYWSYAGDSDRSDVNLTNLQYFYYYSITPTINIGAAPNIIANWEQRGDDRFTVPVGLGINTTVNFGKVPVRFGLEFHKSVIKPDDVPGSDYDIRFFIIPAVPSALFKWMEKPLFGD